LPPCLEQFYDYNFKPGDVVNGTYLAMEPKGAMIDIGAKRAAFIALQESRQPGRGSQRCGCRLARFA